MIQSIQSVSIRSFQCFQNKFWGESFISWEILALHSEPGPRDISKGWSIPQHRNVSLDQLSFAEHLQICSSVALPCACAALGYDKATSMKTKG